MMGAQFGGTECSLGFSTKGFFSKRPEDMAFG